MIEKRRKGAVGEREEERELKQIKGKRKSEKGEGEEGMWKQRGEKTRRAGENEMKREK